MYFLCRHAQNSIQFHLIHLPFFPTSHFPNFISVSALAQQASFNQMNIEQELLQEHSKAQALRIAGFIDGDPEKFAELMGFYLNSGYRTTQRAAMAVSICTDRHPELIYPYLDKLITNLKKPAHDAIKRNTVRILQNIEIPERLWGEVWDLCYDFLTDGRQPVAVRAFSMTVLFNLVKKLPGLKNELKIAIEDQMPYGSAGIISRGGKILMKLEKL